MTGEIIRAFSETAPIVAVIGMTLIALIKIVPLWLSQIEQGKNARADLYTKSQEKIWEGMAQAYASVSTRLESTECQIKAMCQQLYTMDERCSKRHINR